MTLAFTDRPTFTDQKGGLVFTDEPLSGISEIPESGGILSPIKSGAKGLFAGTIDIGDSFETAADYVTKRLGIGMEPGKPVKLRPEGKLAQMRRKSDILTKEDPYRARREAAVKALPKIDEIGEPPESIRGKNVVDNPEILKDPDWWTYNIGRMAPSLAASIVPAEKAKKAITIAGKAVNMTPKVIKRVASLGAAITGGVVGGGLEASSTYREQLEQTGDEKEAARAAELMFFFTAGLNALSTGKILDTAGKSLLPKVGKTITAAAFEAVTEGAEEPAEITAKLGAKLITGKELPKDIKDQYIQSLKDAATVAPVAFVTGGGAAVPSQIGGLRAPEIEIVGKPGPELPPIDVNDIRAGIESGQITPEDAMAMKEQFPELSEAIDSALGPQDLFPGQTPEEQAEIEQEIRRQRAGRQDLSRQPAKEPESVFPYAPGQEQQQQIEKDWSDYVAAEEAATQARLKLARRQFGMREPSGAIPGMEVDPGQLNKELGIAQPQERTALPPGQGFELKGEPYTPGMLPAKPIELPHEGLKFTDKPNVPQELEAEQVKPEGSVDEFNSQYPDHALKYDGEQDRRGDVSIEPTTKEKSIDNAIKSKEQQIDDLETQIKDWSERVYKKHGGKVRVGTNEEQGDTPWEPGEKSYSVDYLNEKRRQSTIANFMEQIKDAKHEISVLKNIDPDEDIDPITESARVLYDALGKRETGTIDTQLARHKRYESFINYLNQSHKKEAAKRFDTPQAEGEYLSYLLGDKQDLRRSERRQEPQPDTGGASPESQRQGPPLSPIDLTQTPDRRVLGERRGKINPGDTVRHKRAKYQVEEIEDDRALISNARLEKIVPLSELSQWEQPKKPVEAQQPTGEKKSVGMAWMGAAWKPVTAAYQIQRGKNKGKYRVTLPSGRKKLVDEKSVRLVDVEIPKKQISNPNRKKILWRGENEGTGKRTATLGYGLYFGLSKEKASAYGKPKIYVNAYPSNPLILKPNETLNDWILKNTEFKRISEFNKKYKTPDVYLKGLGYDGVVNEMYDEVVNFNPKDIKSFDNIRDAKEYLKRGQNKSSKIIETLKNETGSSELANDILTKGAELYQSGAKTFGRFRREMQKAFKDVWEKIKKHIRNIWDLINNQRGEIIIKKEQTSQKRIDEFVANLNKKRQGESITETEKVHRNGGRYRRLEALSPKLDSFIYWIVDKNRPFQAIQRKLKTVTDDIDLFLKETQRPKRTASRVEKAWDEDIRPFIEEVGKSEYSLQDVELYAHAKHAREANKALTESNSKRYYDSLVSILSGKDKQAAINDSIDALDPKEWHDTLLGAFEKFKDREGISDLKEKWDEFSSKPSGMTNAEAGDVLNQYKGDRHIERLRRMLSAINDAKLDLLVDAGLISGEEYNSIKNKYQFYVPLYREGYDDKMYGASRGLKPSGRPVKIRGGSTRNVVNIVANSVANYEKAINMAEKARSTRALKGLIESNPDPDLWTIGKVKKAPTYDAFGNIRMYPDLFNVNDNEFRFVVDGKQYLLTVNRDNKNAMTMLKTLKAEPSMTGPYLNALAKFNQYLARINTSLSPEFILSNFVRDLQTAGINIKDTGVKGKRMLTGAIESGRAIYRAERGKRRGDDLEALYDRFKAAGGKIGWADVHSSIENLSKKITREIEIQQGKRPSRKMVNETFALISDMNTAVENGVRLHAFRLATEQGFSDERAAQIASDLTVDFTKKGAAGPLINSLYLFANAGIQGSYRIMRAATKSRSVQKTLVGIFGVGFMTGLANSMMGDDEDGEDYFNKIPDFVMERNAVFIIPGTGGKYAKIPLPWGYNFVWNLGTEFSRMITKKQYSPMDGAIRTANTFIGAFNPIASGTLLQTLSPTISDPFVQVAENKNWFGGDLMPSEDKFSNIPKPDSQRYWKSARTPSVWVANQLNALTGGDKVKKGMIDVSPETLDLMADTLGGSALRFFTDTFEVPTKLIRKEEVQFHEIPFLRRIAGEKTEMSDSSIYYGNIEQIFEAKERLDVYRGTDQYKSILKQTGKERKLIGIAEDTEKELKRMRKAKKRHEAMGNKEMADKIKKRMNKAMVRFNKKFNEK